MTGIVNDPKVQQCIQDCLQCWAACRGAALRQCLDLGGPHAEQDHLSLMMNCADLCQATANFMLSGSTLHSEVCAVCAKVCGACAQSCRQLGQLQDCEDACRRCADSCKEVAGTGMPATQTDDRLPTTGLPGGPARQGAYG
ncbi:four-helix bundle copper-binding protein [Eleftheria terrae]|uniref:four-helix bundle copper-binding protein n=1 Tax=Eleftheria terrae TaxID=1597781 RepID=UPI00263B091E|nr:four-helix bundle copper-binding protein [Eleftheria terrae]WKB53492.1 four-helix bundle copper-binding protein [Eleftheria terrae]